MFTNAKKAAAIPAPAKGKTPERPTETFPGLADVAALEACSKALKGLIDVKKAALKEIASTQLIETGLERHSRPDTMQLAEDEATGRATVVKRSSASPLSSDELEFLATLTDAVRDADGNITTIPGFAETVESVPAMLAVNPIYANDEVLLAKIDKALSKVAGIPDDFIMQYPAKGKVVVSEGATDAMFRLSPEIAEQAFPVIAGVTISTVFKNLARAWEIVKPMLVPDAKVEVKKMLKASLKAV